VEVHGKRAAVDSSELRRSGHANYTGALVHKTVSEKRPRTFPNGYSDPTRASNVVRGSQVARIGTVMTRTAAHELHVESRIGGRAIAVCCERTSLRLASTYSTYPELPPT
jgi:hypothetical protein